MARRRRGPLRSSALAACVLCAAALPLSKPIVRDANVASAKSNKFLQRSATRDNRAPGRHAHARTMSARALLPR
jgi:hypothetical protein